METWLEMSELPVVVQNRICMLYTVKTEIERTIKALDSSYLKIIYICFKINSYQDSSFLVFWPWVCLSYIPCKADVSYIARELD